MITKTHAQDSVTQQAENRQDDWVLSADQMIFMLQRHNSILAAYEEEDMDFLSQLESSDEYKTAFESMSWDEAFDRYESMLEKRHEA